MFYKEDCEIVDVKLDGHYIWMTMKTDEIALASVPGQFINIRVNSLYDPLLRRPMSICNVDGNNITILVLVRGRGSRILAEKKKGDVLNIIGPLGNCFPIRKKKAIFLAGGIGVAPFLYLSKSYDKPKLLFGVKGKEWLPDIKPFEKYCDLKIISEDGSTGEKGTILSLVEDMLFNKVVDDVIIYACGPNPMLKALTGFFRKKNVDEVYYSLESFMACGFGACKGCAVTTPEGNYKLVCTDGPIFKWNEVVL